MTLTDGTKHCLINSVQPTELTVIRTRQEMYFGPNKWWRQRNQLCDG